MREDGFYSVLKAVDNGVQTIHISGEPGIGKSTFLMDLEDELSEWYRTRILYVREDYTTTSLSQELLYEARDAVGTLRTLFNEVTGFSLGAGRRRDTTPATTTHPPWPHT
ncbi:hypothetical protein, partial [Haloferax volcanii]|uniref:hypothetical protein n=1 Tax=Haloferax volcanii TaxID=2246 RepID=UPI001C94F116